MGVVPRWTFAILGFLFYVSATLNVELKKSLEWSELEYEDSCSEVANAAWEFLKNPTNQTLQIWEETQIQYRFVIKDQKNLSSEFLNRTDTSSVIERIKLVKNPGDALLSDEDWKDLVHFAGTAELMRSYPEKSRNLSREAIEKLLSHSGEAKEKLSVWSNWHNHLAPLQTNFSKILLLVNKAAEINGEENAQSYWETLTEYPDGYENLKSLWEEISALHKKFVHFVALRLAAKYKIPLNNTVPVHLLGSLQGKEWTSLATDIIPHTDRIFKIKENMWEKNLLGRNLYAAASKLGIALVKEAPEADFWEKSEFNKTCPSRIVNFCKDGKMRVFSCYEASLSNYISAHKNIGKVIFNQLASRSENPIFKISNRFSVLEESFAEFFGIMSMSPAWLQSIGLVKKEEWESNEDLKEEFKLVSTVITVLDVLPRLAYYVSADMWRLEALEKKITDPKELTSSWWKHRREFEAVTTDFEDIPSFLDDEFITSNRPYLSKFVGTILAFSLYEQRFVGVELNFNPIEFSNVFARIALNSSMDNWMDLIKKLTESDISEVTADSITFFLDNYLNEQEKSKILIPIERQTEFEKQEVIYRQKALTPTTTTTTTTSTTRKPITQERKAVSVKSSKAIEVPPTEATKAKVYDLEIPEIEAKKETEPKPTNKAVYAVGAVLVATVLVSIIAIFGRRRCTKTPKNRRYV